MSLPRRPNVGLPSNPRARSLIAQATQDIPPRPRSSASERPPPSSFTARPPPLPAQPRALHPQRSVGSLPDRPTGAVRSRSLGRDDSRHAFSRADPPPPLPSLPSLPRSPREGRSPTVRRGDVQTHASSRSWDHSTYRKRDDRISHSTSSSSASDDLRSPASPASSRTSLDEGEADENKPDKKMAVGVGSSLWRNITGVAGNLTISVSKAWSSNVATFSGEDTPPGAESRLTRAMKAYHLENARDPSDLPDWLFNEQERGVRVRRAAPSTDADAPELETQASGLSRFSPTTDEDAPPVRVARGPTLADRKAAAAAAASSSSSGRPTVRAPDELSGGHAHVTKSMARLRELRDAKRNAKVRFDETEDDAGAAPQEWYRSSPPPLARRPTFMPGGGPRARGADVDADLGGDRDVFGGAPPPMRPRGVPFGAPSFPSSSSLSNAGVSLGVRGRQPTTRLGLPASVRPVRA